MAASDSSVMFFMITAASLIAIGLYGFISGPEVLRRVLALNIISAGVFMLMVVLAYRGTVPGAANGLVDPVLHALVLTGLVVAVSATAFALALLARLSQASSAPTVPHKRTLQKAQQEVEH
ncbi:NADH-quinone oxidoreductase subunit K [Arsukibacterium indicum]|uniref:NADH-quinone oxidoreductase subunit K n=1 Tax=Arsukibacterium indicum TaxID=2848612 RepID=A0ABS6MIG6_9GAMM|nr:NADH-quinone oxidoreductase subunit K [Arsukibacterium indicum]MBV2128592.1 NADH-quinone oxidoreductase subunit K [Arsukibacterium indicum]